MRAIILQGQKKKYTVPNPFAKAKAIAPNSKDKMSIPDQTEPPIPGQTEPLL
jgi:hypothetical protein